MGSRFSHRLQPQITQIFTDGFGGDMAEFLYKELTYAIIGAAMEVHKILGGGISGSRLPESAGLRTALARHPVRGAGASPGLLQGATGR
jgi:hypothetical protein